MSLTSVVKRRGIHALGELVARGVIPYGEALAAVLAANGAPADGTARRCALAWELADSVDSWMRDYDRAVWDALRATREAISAGERDGERLFRVALGAAERVLPGAVSREVLQPLLADQWVALGKYRQ